MALYGELVVYLTILPVFFDYWFLITLVRKYFYIGLPSAVLFEGLCIYASIHFLENINCKLPFHFQTKTSDTLEIVYIYAFNCAVLDFY